jgi:hypothetical protein
VVETYFSAIWGLWGPPGFFFFFFFFFFFGLKRGRGYPCPYLQAAV